MCERENKCKYAEAAVILRDLNVHSVVMNDSNSCLKHLITWITCICIKSTIASASYQLLY